MQDLLASRDLARVARVVEAAARALHGWQARAADESARELWLLISRADPMQSGGTVADRAGEDGAGLVPPRPSAGGHRRGGSGGRRVVAHHPARGRPGAASYLAHGRRDSPARAEIGSATSRRASIFSSRETREAGEDACRAAARRAGAAADARDAATGSRSASRRSRPRSGPLDVEMTCSGRLEMDSHGVVIDLIGADPRTLAELLADLEARSARRRATIGIGPRSAASTARMAWPPAIRGRARRWRG